MTSEVKMMSKAGNSARISQPQFLEHVSGPGTKGTRGAMPKEVMQEDDAKNGKKNMNINMKCPEPTDAVGGAQPATPSSVYSANL